MILRELVARLGLDLDRKSFDTADQDISGLKRGLEFAGKAAATLGVALAAGIGVGVKMAADANETLNLMGLVFEGNQGKVLAWADAVSAAAGRSKYELREMVTQVGSFLKPMLGDLDASTDLAEQLTERAIDFASAMNITDTDAIQKFTAGMAGETEPLRRFGVNMTVAALQAFALEQGITKTVAKMNDAEKTQLRFAFLMARTADYQGDAANTAESFANATKALRSKITDLGTNIGMKFLPTAEGVIRVARDVVGALADWVEHSNIVQAAIITFGTIATAIAIRVAAAWAVANWPIVLAGLALAALVLIVDDFLTFLNGGDSVIGSFIDSIWGPGSAAEAARNFHIVLDALAGFWRDVLWPAAKDLAAGLAQWFGDTFEAIGRWVLQNEDMLMRWHDTVVATLKAIKRAIVDLLQALGELFGFDLRTWWDNAQKSLGLRVEQTTKFERQAQRGMGDAPTHPAVASAMSSDPTMAASMSMSAPAPTVPISPVTQLMSTMNESRPVINQSVAVSVDPATPREQARNVATTTSDELRRMNREAHAGLVQRAAAD